MVANTGVIAKKGMVASAHSMASAAGADVLSKGGNVIDAAIATSAALCVVQNNSCGLGGDTFVLLKIDGKVMEINGSGRATKGVTIDFFESEGYSSIPRNGPLSCVTVPGLVHAWGELQKYATMELSDLLLPAIRYAEGGVPLNAKYVESIKASNDTLGCFVGWRSLFMPGGNVPEPGFVLKQNDLSNSLKMIARQGTGTFYRGELAEKICSGATDAGALLDLEDLRNHTSTWRAPISIDYRGTKIYETSPNSQAATVLLWLNMLEQYDLDGLSGDQVQKILVETCLKAYGERAKWIGDPSFVPFPSEFTSKEYAMRILGSTGRAIRERREPKEDGDTTYFAVADREGDCVSMIQSNYNGFGSGIVPQGTGIVLHNRGCYFSLNRSHHNSLAPGKRTFHTLCASMGEKDGKTLFALGAMGGDVQPQVHVQLLTKILDFKTELQVAISSPRWVMPGTIYEPLSSIYFEQGLVPSEGIPGHLKVEHLSGLSSITGHANAVYLTSDAVLGAADPRCEGSAIGV